MNYAYTIQYWSPSSSAWVRPAWAYMGYVTLGNAKRHLEEHATPADRYQIVGDNGEVLYTKTRNGAYDGSNVEKDDNILPDAIFSYDIEQFRDGQWELASAGFGLLDTAKGSVEKWAKEEPGSQWRILRVKREPILEYVRPAEATWKTL